MKTVFAKAAALILCLTTLLCVLSSCGESSSSAQNSQTTSVSDGAGSTEAAMDFDELD